ncbi:unnamed protein product [Arctia plantaginis]|uniref:Uncharacterized protein n=1 Tax=Arctia plantaginis TaxID=874455 RepID=A0A8S1B6M0_ARCPL|nr:unnamed protein product [Arctia plantaginis]
MCTPEAWRGGVARSPSHESVTTDLSLFSVSSAASDARVLRLLACKAGQGPDPSLRVASPNPDSKTLKRPSSSLPLQSTDNCRELLAGCAALCAQLGLRRSFSCSDVSAAKESAHPLRSATSEVGLCAALEALTLSAASRSCSTWVAGENKLYKEKVADHIQSLGEDVAVRLQLGQAGGESFPSVFRHGMPLSGAAAVSAVANAVSGPGPTTLAVPQAKHPHSRFVHPEAAHLALTAADLERERGRPLSKYERNMMIFNWLHTLDEAAPF